MDDAACLWCDVDDDGVQDITAYPAGRYHPACHVAFSARIASQAAVR